jgi:transglutaminase-like putative cysteine protease
MDTRRPQLDLDELWQLRWGLGTVLGLVSAWTVPFMDIGSWGPVAFVTAAAVFALWRPAWPARVPGWIHRLAFPVIVALLVADLYAYREPLPAFIRLNLMLIGYRLLCHRRRRDDLQLIVLGLFLVVVAGVLTVSIAFAGQILLFTACALGFLLTITLTEAAGPAAAAGPAPGAPRRGQHRSWTGLRRRVRATTDWRLAALGAALFAGVVALSGLLFLAIPRFELSNSLFLDRLINRQTKTGFSDEIRFGEVTDIQQDESIALNVDVSDPSRLPAQPYWRMVVLDDYVGGGFRISPRLRRELNQTTGRATRLRGTARSRHDPTEWTFYFEAGVSRYLPLLGNYINLSFTEAQSVGVGYTQRVVALDRDPPRMFAYRVSGMETTPYLPHADLALQRRAGDVDDPAAALDAVLGPGGRERLRAFNAEILGGSAPAAGEYAQRAGEWLAARHAYSLQSSLPPGEGDPLVRWIGSNAPGHCELFAGALVLLAREAGFPARLVAGFRGGSWNAFSNSFTVRNSHAHAWVEIFDDESGGWLRADPTPGAALPGEEAGPAGAGAAADLVADESWAARLEGLRVFWYRRIVNFDQESQLGLAQAAKEAVEGGGRRLRGRIEELKTWLAAWWARPWDAGRWSGLALAAGGVAAALLLWRTRGRGWWLRWRSGLSRRSRSDPVRREAGRWLGRLRDAGLDATPVGGELARLRFGPRPSWPEPAAVFARARRTLRRRT